jgi:BirA family biotin operon repressor/biotin-[acetyl-CoA-carboxylase] ligase
MDIKHIHFETIDSTNTWAKTHTENLSPDKLTVISADHQLGGRGRFNRSWISPPHKNLISTFCFFSEFPDIRNIPQILALSALELLEEHGLKAALKWPNDINAGPKKMGGILAETSAEESCLWCFI